MNTGSEACEGCGELHTGPCADAREPEPPVVTTRYGAGHGIDVCACGRVLILCRCPGLHTTRVIAQDCDVCRVAAPSTMLDFGDALRALKAGKRVARAGWNGKGMWLVLVGPRWDAATQARSEYDPAWELISGGVPGAEIARMLPWIGMKTADDSFVPWLASQTDMLAEDWEVVS